MFKSSKSRGFTLVEVLIGAGVSAGVALLATTVITHNAKSDRDTQIRMNSNTHHLLAYYQLVNPVQASGFLGVRKADHSANPRLYDCLNGRGTNCLQLASTDTPLNDSRGDFNSVINANGGKCPGNQVSAACPVRQTTTYRPSCSSDARCESVEIEIRTTLEVADTRPGVSRPKISSVRHNAKALTGDYEFDFSCAATNPKIVTHFNPARLTANCENISGTMSCAGGGAAGPYLSRFAGVAGEACQSGVSASCPKGIVSVGLMNGGQVQCAN